MSASSNPVQGKQGGAGPLVGHWVGPRVGVGVYIFHQGKVLFLQRGGQNGLGRWSPPGGHLEAGETWASCAAREAREEVGIAISNPRLMSLTEDIDAAAGTHYITLHVEAQAPGFEYEDREPAKQRNYRWVEWHNLPQPLFLPCENFLKQGIQPTWA